MLNAEGEEPRPEVMTMPDLTHWLVWFLPDECRPWKTAIHMKRIFDVSGIQFEGKP